MKLIRSGLIALLLVAPAAAFAQPDDDQPLYWALDRMLMRLEGRLSAPDGIAPDLRTGRAITVADNAATMNVDAVAEVLEALPNDRYRVRVSGNEKVPTISSDRWGWGKGRSASAARMASGLRRC